MDWVALSSRYYLDLDDAGVSERAQTLLTRSLAYMAENETGGYITKSALKKLGLSSLSSRLRELVDEQIMVEVLGENRYHFPAWLKWNEPLERQVKKRKADRKRIADKRAEEQNVALHSGDMSPDVASLPNLTTTKEELTYVSPSPPVSDAPAKPRRGVRQIADHLNGKSHSRQAHLVAARYADSCRHRPPGDTLAKIAQAIDGCIQSGFAEEHIEIGLAAWTASEMHSPSQIPHFVHKAANRAEAATQPGVGKPTIRAAGWATSGRDTEGLVFADDPALTTTTTKEITA